MALGAERDESMRLEAVDAAVVCFESAPDDEHGAHAAVIVANHYGAFPPNTLFRFKTVMEAGTWEGPGGVKPNHSS
jgi:hypothetical protein